MKQIGVREVFFSETFILPEGETALFDAAPRGFPLTIEVVAVKVEGSPPAQAHVNWIAPTPAMPVAKVTTCLG